MKRPLVQLLKYFYKPYIFLLIAISLSGILLAIFEALNVAVAFPVISSIIGSKSAESGSRIIQCIQKGIEIVPVRDKFIAVFLLFLIITILVNLFRYIYAALTQISSYIIMRDFQKRTYKKIIQSDYQYFLDTKQGKLMYRIIVAPGQMIRIFLVIPRLVIEALTFLSIILILFTISFKLTFGILIIGFFFYLLNRRIAREISYNTGKGRVTAGGKQNVLASEAISGIRQMKAFLGERRWINEFFKVSDNFAKFAVKDSLFLPLPQSLLAILSISFICIASIAMKLKMGNSFTTFLPVLGVYLYALMRIIPSMGSFGQMHMQFMGGLPYAESVYEELHKESCRINDGTEILNLFNSSICFNNVSFTYPKRHETLKDINIVFEKGKVTAMVGPSGSGKSTIIDLILRLYLPTSGKILVDGQNLSKLKISSWLDKIGFVSQDTFIFNAPIADNISFSFGEFTSSREKVIAAAKVANAHEFISAWPEGSNTIGVDRGLKLSGGERQRVAIARAVYKKPEILIFDEATSSLDSKAEKIVQNAINTISRDHTVRLSTIVNADKIIVIDNGIIVEEGDHHTLMEEEGLYWQLYNEQNGLAKNTVEQCQKL